MKILGALAAAVIALFGGGPATPQVNLGTAVPLSPALYDGYLASGITSSATSMTLSTGTLRNGTALSGFFCFTLDNGQPTTEYVCGTASSTSVTGLMRGVDVLNPNTTSTAYAFAHRRFASAQITDYPTLQFLVRKANGTDGYDAPLNYASVSTSTIGSDPDNLVNVEYVSGVAVTGCADASTSIRGCVEAATTAETILGTGTGGTGALLFPQNSLFSPTSTATTIAPLTNTAGKLSQAFLDLTSAFTFSGGLTSSGVTTLSSSTIFSSITSGSLIASGGSGAATGIAPSTSGNVLMSNGSAWASTAIPHNIGTGTAAPSLGTTSTLFNIPAVVGATVVVNCDVYQVGNNTAATHNIKLGATTLSTCDLRLPTNTDASCSLNSAFVASAVTSTVYASSTGVQANTYRCVYYTL